MSTIEKQTVIIDPNAAFIVVLKQAREGGVRFPNKGSACAWLKQSDACNFLFGPKPEMKSKFKAIKRDIHHPQKESGVLMRLNRLWVNAVAWKAMELAQVGKEDCITMSQALCAAQDTMRREMALDAIIAVVQEHSDKLAADNAAREAESEARRLEKLSLIQAILDNILDGVLRNNILYSKLNAAKKHQVDTIIAGEGMKIQVGQLQELLKLLERLGNSPTGVGGGGRHGKGKDPRKAEKAARDRAIRAAMKGKQGQKPQLGSKK
jgi:hypothetical protein